MATPLPTIPNVYSHYQPLNWTVLDEERTPTPDLTYWPFPVTTSVYVSSADTNQKMAKIGRATLYALLAVNSNANFDRYLRLYDTAAAPVAGVGTPVRTVIVPRGGATLVYSQGGEAYLTGIGFTITGGAGDADTTPINAGEILVVTTTDKIALVTVNNTSTGFGILTGLLAVDTGLGFGTIG